MNLLFTFSDNTNLSSDFILDSAKITECFYNQLKSADNSAQVKVPFNENLCDKLKAEISRKVKVQIIDGLDTIFTGYVRNNLQFSKTQRNQPFSLEIVSPSILLDYTYSGTLVHYTNVTLADVVLSLLSFTPFQGDINVLKLENKTIGIFTVSDGANIKTELTELLFEYGYGFDFDNMGNFYITEMFIVPQLEIPQKFNGDNCLNQIEQTVKEDSYKKVNVKWTKSEYKEDVLIFEDTTGATNKQSSSIPIKKHSYYLDTEINYLNYDSKYQDILFIQSARAVISYDNTSGITERFVNHGTQGELSIYNDSDIQKTIKQLKVVGNGYFAISDNQTKVGQNGNEYSHDAKYIQNEWDASYLARKIGDYFNYSNFTIKIVSKTKYESGSFVEVSDSGIGTIRARIVKRIWNIKLNQYEYTLESISDFQPIETYQNKQNVNSSKDNGESIKDVVNDLEERIDEIVTDTTICSADVLTTVIKTDSDSRAIMNYNIETNITLRQNSEELEFNIGTINVPNGWTYEVKGKKLIFHVEEGAFINSSQFAIPVQYRQIVEETFYTDENGNQYVDENNESYAYIRKSQSYTQWSLYFSYFGDSNGSYLGVLTSIGDIPEITGYNNYFVWGGITCETNLTPDGKLYQSGLYKYVGLKGTYSWTRDDGGDHGLIALGDILSVANDDLARNNGKTWCYLNHLTSNSIFADLLAINQGFIKTLVNQQLFTDLIKSATGIFENIRVTGTGHLQDLLVDGNSRFNGEIISGPIECINNAPMSGSITFYYGEDLATKNVEKYNAYNTIGTYLGITFDEIELLDINGGAPSQTIAYPVWDLTTGKFLGYQTTTLAPTYLNGKRLKLYRNGVIVYDDMIDGGLKPDYYYQPYTLQGDMIINYVSSGEEKTLKLKNLPKYPPNEPNVVWNDNGVLKIS